MSQVALPCFLRLNNNMSYLFPIKCICNKWPHPWWLKTTHIPYSLSHSSVGQKSRLAQLVSLLNSMCRQLASSEAAVGRICSQTYSCCWQNPIPWSCETRVPISLLVVSCEPPLAPEVSPLARELCISEPATRDKSFSHLESLWLSFLPHLSTASSWRKFSALKGSCLLPVIQATLPIWSL